MNKLKYIASKNSKFLQGIESHLVGKELIFRSKYVFTAKDLGKILKIYTPLDANAYWEDVKNNVLTLRFYKI